MIRTLEGRVGSGKTSVVLDEIARAVGDGERVLWLVPEQTTLQSELMLAEKLDSPGFLLAEVLSPSRLASRVLEAAGGLAGRQMITEQGRAFALRACLADIDLAYYGGCAGKAGFIEWLLRLTDEMGRNGIEPTSLRLCADGLADSPLQRKLYDIAAILDHYNESIAGRFLDGNGALELFAERAGRVPFVREALVWVDGFDIMPPRTLRQIVALAAAAKQVTVALTLPDPGDEGDGLFDAVKLSRERLEEYARAAGVPLVSERLRRRPYQSAEISHLEAQWDYFPSDPYPGIPKDISLSIAKNPGVEAAHCASEIYRLARKMNFRFGEMAVACGGLDGYAPHILRAFAERDIPCFISREIAASAHPAARYWLAAMEAATTGMRPEAVLRALRSGYAGVSEDDADRLANLQYTKGLWGGGWERTVEDDEALDAERRIFVEPLFAFGQRVKGSVSAHEFAHAAYLLLEEAGVYSRLTDEALRLETSGHMELAQHNAQVWRQITGALDQAVELLGVRRLPAAHMLLALRSALDAATLGALPPRPDAVLVTDIARVKGSGIKALFVLGLNDGLIPATGASAELLSNAERLEVNQTSRKLSLAGRLNADAERDQAERFAIYAALTLPTHKLILSYSGADESGGARRHSLLRDRFTAIFPQMKMRDIAQANADTPRASLWCVAARMRKSGGEDIRARRIFRYLASQTEWTDEAARILAHMGEKPREESVGSETAARLYGERLHMGITRIERFALCPYQHFVDYALRPKELYPPGVRPVDAGIVYHAAFEEFVRSVTHWGSLTDRECQQLAAAAVAPAIEEILSKQEDTPRLRARLAELGRVAVRSATVLARQLCASRFLPVGQEIAFGDGKPHPPLELLLPGVSPIYLEGRIDRVDVCDLDGTRYLRVIDYKSGKIRLDRAAVEAGRLLQLPIYARVAQSAMQAETAGLFYFRAARSLIDEPEEDHALAIARKNKLEGLLLKDTDIARAMDANLASTSDVLPVRLKKDGDFYATSPVLNPAEMRSLLDGAVDSAAQLAAQMLSGDIAPRPIRDKTTDACEFCTYRAVCGFEG